MTDAAGATSTAKVGAAAECTWTAASDSSWIVEPTPPSGQGAGQVQFRVMANPDPVVRQGNLAVNGVQLHVTQAAASCRFEVTPRTPQISGDGGLATLTLTAASSACAWTATADVPWLAIRAPASGSGNATITVQVAANSGNARTGTITVGGVSVVVSQDASVCAYVLQPASQAIGSAGGPGVAVSVTAASGCLWTVTSDAPWITVTAGASGNGPGTIAFTVALNTGPERTGVLTVAGKTSTITQAAAQLNCSYSINSSAQNAPAVGGAGTPVQVTTSNGCAWTATSGVPWIKIASGASGTGSGTVSFTIDPNPGAARNGTLTIAGQTLTVTQAAVACTYQISSSSQSIGAAGGNGTVGVTSPAGCAWTATSGASWITITSGASGSGSGTVGFTVADNSGSGRSGTIAIADKVLTVTQAASPCSYQITPASQSIAAAGGNGTPFTVATAAGCAWTATSGVPWITITSGASGIGPGAVGFTVAPNTVTTGRSGTVTIASQTFTVNQAAAPCTYQIAPTAQSMPAAGGAGTPVAVTTPAGCAWTATSGVPWIAITSGASGNGPGSVAFTVAANTGTGRSGTLTIGGQTFTVTQAAAPCTYQIAPTAQSIGFAGGAGTPVTVTTAAGCAWTATSQASWITITPPGSGSGAGTVNFTIAANALTTGRTGTFTVADQTFTVTQAGR